MRNLPPEERMILDIGRQVLKARLAYLETIEFSPAAKLAKDRLFALWDCYKMVYTRLFHGWPRFQVRFY